MVKRVLTLVVGSLALVACGPGAKIDGKQGAAEAMFAASKPSSAKADTSSTPVDVTGGINYKCPEGGTAAITGTGVSIGIGQSTSVGTNFTLQYDNCGLAKGDVGVAIFNGKMTFAQSIVAGGSAVSVDQSFKGRLDVKGAYDDFIEADVKQSIAVGDLGASGTGVSMVLKGTIATSEGTFTFDEMVSVIAGQISAKIDASKM
jgi:hypothetical protein